MAGASESEMSKKVQFIISNSTDARTRLYKTSDKGLLEPANDLDIVESLLIQAVHNAFKDKNVVLLKSCLKPSLSSPRKSKKKVRLLLPPDSRENLDDESLSEEHDSSKKVRFLLPTDSVENLEESSDTLDDLLSDSQDVSTLDDVDILQELDVSWDEITLEHEKQKHTKTEVLASDTTKQKLKKADEYKCEEIQKKVAAPEKQSSKEVSPTKGDHELPCGDDKKFADDVSDSNICSCGNWEYSDDDDFESFDSDTEGESGKEASDSADSNSDDSIGEQHIEAGPVLQKAEPVRAFNTIANDAMEEHGIPEAALHRLRMQNTMHNLKKAASVKIHKPKNCKDCREKLAEVTEKSFLQQKLAVVSEKLLKDKLLLQANPVLEFANGLKDLPSHKDDPAVVYDRLMKTAEQKSSERKQNISVPVQTLESKPPEPMIKHLNDYTEAELKLDNMDLAKEPSEQFWKKYFEPLQDCTWFPKS